MGFPVYDFRTDVRNVLVTPQIRSRFLRLEPGPSTGGHSHDLGHEVFLVLQGRAEFEIDGEVEELGPGQMCVALAGQMHSVHAVGDEPMIMYLSVTPHIQPTHTMWGEDGQRLPHRFTPSSSYDADTDTETPIADLVDELVRSTDALAQAARGAATAEAKLAEALKGALASGDEGKAARTRGDMWDALAPAYKLSHELASKWNDLAPRAGPTE